MAVMSGSKIEPEDANTTFAPVSAREKRLPIQARMPLLKKGAMENQSRRRRNRKDRHSFLQATRNYLPQPSLPDQNSRKTLDDESEDSRMNYFCQTTPLHGFQSITLSNQKWKKAVWGTFIALSCALGTYQIGQVIVEYHKLNTAFSVSMVRPNKLKFPDVMICDSNPSNHSQLEYLQIERTGKYRYAMLLISKFSINWELKNVITASELLSKGTDPGLNMSFHSLQQLQTEYNMTFRDVVLSLGHRSSELLSACTKGRMDASGNAVPENCTEIAKPLVYHKYGVCYVIRGKNQSKHEPVFGSFGALLNVHVVLNRDAYIPRSYRPEGIYIGIAYQYESEFDSQLLSAIPGTFTMIHLKPKKVWNLDHPKAPCHKDSVETLLACHKRCEMNIFYRLCNCVPVIFHHLDENKKTCEVDDIVECVAKTTSTGIDLFNVTEKCKKRCRVPCIEWTYETTESDMRYYINESLADSNATKNSVREWERKTNIQLFMTNLEYNEYKQFYTMTFDTLLGAIGGLFGIYLGGSMLAVLHCLFTFLEMMSRKYHKRTDKEPKSSLNKKKNKLRFVPCDPTARSNSLTNHLPPLPRTGDEEASSHALNNGYNPDTAYIEVNV